MLAQARFTLFVLVASLFALTAAAPASAASLSVEISPQTFTERQVQELTVTFSGTADHNRSVVGLEEFPDDGTGCPSQQSPSYSWGGPGGYEDFPAGPFSFTKKVRAPGAGKWKYCGYLWHAETTWVKDVTATGPVITVYADSDYDGVANQSDACPGKPGFGSSYAPTADGCVPDSDGDGLRDDEDRCRDEPSGGYPSPWAPGCPKPPGPDDKANTPAADGPSCTKKQRCIVFEQEGLVMKPNGSYEDPNARVTITIARNAEGVPARVVSIELSKVDTACYTPDGSTASGYATTAGPEVSTTLDALALERTRERYPGESYDEYRLDPEAPVRTINGLKYELNFFTTTDGGMQEASFGMKGAQADKETGKCIVDVRTSLPRDARGVGVRMVSMGLKDLLGAGRQGFACGQPKKRSVGWRFEIDCRIEVKLTVPKKLAKRLGLDSRVLAQGVAGDRVDKHKADGTNWGRTYFLKIPDISELRAKLKKKNVTSLRGRFEATVTARGAREADCASDEDEVDPYQVDAECQFKGRFTWYEG